MNIGEKKIYCELIAQLLIADGVFAHAEREFLNSAMDRLGLTQEDRREVFRNVNMDDPIDRKLSKLGKEARRRLTDELEAAAQVDDVMAASEAELIKRIREVMEG